MTMRTPLARVRGLGSAKEGTDHFWMQRLTAIANIVLTPVLVYSIVTHVGQDHQTVKSFLGSPFIAILMMLFILSGVIHMRLGMQVIIEDYVHSEWQKITLLIANTLFAILIGMTSIFAILKLSFGA